MYPYEYMDSEERLNEEALPPRESFWSQLRHELPKEVDYERALRMFDLFECKNLRDYTELYVKLDVLLLATIMEESRKAAIKEGSAELDPVNFITAPSFSWAAMLWRNWKNGVTIENMLDADMLMMAERMVRGGMCQILTPHAVAEGGWHILYLDANNLYGKAMTFPMPLCDYRHEYSSNTEGGQDDIDPGPYGFERQIIDHPVYERTEFWGDVDWVIEHVGAMDDEQERGYVLEVDIDVPDPIHDDMNAYPLLPHPKVGGGVTLFRMLGLINWLRTNPCPVWPRRYRYLRRSLSVSILRLASNRSRMGLSARARCSFSTWNLKGTM